MKEISEIEFSIRTAYPLYYSFFEIHKDNPNYFDKFSINNIIGAIFSARKYAWRVVGITEVALSCYEKADFSKDAARKYGLRRAHLRQRIDTTRLLMETERPLSIAQVSRTFWEHDMTVICAKGENRKYFRDYIPIENPSWSLFSGKAIGWAFGQDERECLRGLASQRKRTNLATKDQIG